MAFADISSNRSNILKYQDNPKIKKVMEKLQSSFGPGPAGGPPPDTDPSQDPPQDDPPPSGPTDMGLD